MKGMKKITMMSKKGWEIKKLGDVCELITKGTTPTSVGFKFTDEGINFIKVESLTESGKIIPEKVAFISDECHQALKRSQLKADDILFSIAGALGRIGIVGEEILPANTNQALAIIRLKQEANVSVNFLSKYFISESVSEQIEKLRGGVAQQNLSLGQLNDLQIPVPTIKVQQQIVFILDEAFTAIDQAKQNLHRNLQNAKELFQSELSNIFTTKGTNWVDRKIEDVAKVVNGFSFKSNDFSPNNKIKSVKITNVGVKEFVEETDNYLPETFSKTYSEYSVQEGNIVIALTRTIISSGLKVAVVPESYEGALINQRVAALVPDTKIINQRFLYNFLCTDEVMKYVKANVNTLMQPNLSINDLKKLPILLPTIAEQKKIVSQLDSLSAETKNLENIYQQKLDNLEELKKSILQKAFSGELTKTQTEVSV